MYIGTLYGHGFTRTQIDRLSVLGFALRPGTSRFAGAQILRFIDFPVPPALEFIHVEDKAEYSAFVPEGMTPYSPGVSLVIDSHLPVAIDELRSALTPWSPYRIHVAYAGSINPSEPGCNYLNFRKPIIPGTFIYLTEYEEPRPRTPSPLPHPNSALAVTGLVFDLPLRDLAPLSVLASPAGSCDTPLLGNVPVYGANFVPRRTRASKKRFSLVAVVIHVADLGKLGRRTPGLESTEWLGADAVLIRTNPLSWDLIFTEANPRPVDHPR